MLGTSSGIERRSFLQALGVLAAAGAVPQALPALELVAAESGPEAATGSLIERFLCGESPALPSEALFASDPDRFWAELQKQWVFEPGFIYLNNGTIGSMPLPVIRAFFEKALSNCQMEVEEDDTELYPLWGYGPYNQYRAPMAEFINCAVDELALTRNATEGLNCVANGLDMRPGDEIITTDQEHPSGINPWFLKAARMGVVVKQIKLPLPPNSVEEIVELFEAERTSRTRLVMFSHITSSTGTMLPAKELCAWARQHGLLSEVDGAHAAGQVPVDVKDIGCDFYISSPHKWLFAPPGCGFLYVRDEVIDRLWSTIATGQWDDKEIRAQRFQQFGSTNTAMLAGLKASIEFRRAVGVERSFNRMRELHAYLKEEVKHVPGAQVLSAEGERQSHARLLLSGCPGTPERRCFARDLQPRARHLILSSNQP